MATSTTTQSRDYYGDMPEWQRQQLIGDAAFESEFRDAMSNVANKAGDSPRQIAGLSGAERTGAGVIRSATDVTNERLRRLNSGLNGVGVDQDLGSIQDPRAMGTAQSAAGWNDVDTNFVDFQAVDAPSFANLDAIRGGYESAYTDSVVDTTLAGMQRQAQRDQLARESQGAAIGGTSNTRTAVGNAVAQNLSGMSMAEMEAKLRDNAFNTAAQYGLQEGDMRNQFGLDSASFTADQRAAQRQYGLDLADFGLSEQQARAAHDRELADQSLARETAYADNSLARANFSLEEAIAQAQQGNTAAAMELEKAGLSREMINDMMANRLTEGNMLREQGATQRDLRQQQIDANYYGGMEAGSWLADVYSKSRTRDSAPYSFTEDAKTDEKKDKASGWQQFASAAAAGLSSFL